MTWLYDRIIKHEIEEAVKRQLFYAWEDIGCKYKSAYWEFNAKAHLYPMAEAAD